MSRLLLVALNELTSDQRMKIIRSSEKSGFSVFFSSGREESLPFLQDAEIVLSGDPFYAENAAHLCWICTPSAGINQFIGDDIFTSPDVILTNSSGAYGVTISEHIIMILLDILRHQTEVQLANQRREWLRRLPVRSLYGSRFVLLGTGDIGCETAKRIRSFVPKQIVGVNRSGRNPDQTLFDHVVCSKEIDAVLPSADIVIVSLPGTPETVKTLDASRLALLPDGAVIVNVGRGSVIDQEALIKELKMKRLYAGLDVFETEPLPDDDPLWNCPNLLMTPHIAGDTTLPATLDKIVDLFLEDFENYCSGRPLLHIVDLKLGY